MTGHRYTQTRVRGSKISMIEQCKSDPWYPAGISINNKLKAVVLRVGYTKQSDKKTYLTSYKVTIFYELVSQHGNMPNGWKKMLKGFHEKVGENS